MFNFGVLRLCFGIFLLPSTRQFNLALWKDTKHDSVFSDSIFLSGDAVNGNMQQDMENTSCSHTSLNRKFNWWTVDLGQQYLIDNIIIYGRDDCFVSTWTPYNSVEMAKEVQTSLSVETTGVQTTLVEETTEAQTSRIVETTETLTILVIETTEAITSRVVVATDSSYNLNVVTTPAPTILDNLYALLIIPFIVLLILALLFGKYCYRKMDAYTIYKIYVRET